MATTKELWQAALDAVGEEELTRRFRSWITNLTRTARIKSALSESAESAPQSAQSAGNALFLQDVKLILDDLNHRTGSRFTATDQARHLIRNLMPKGYITLKFPDAPALATYQMPDRIRKMRTAPKMITQVLRGQSPQWAEDEFARIKEDAKESPDA